ncbi:hypothetical protein ES703_76709 [subsurface metagenome]
MQFPVIFDHLAGGEATIKPGVVGKKTYSFADLKRAFNYIHAIKPGRALAGFQCGREHSQQGRLARPVGAEES